MEIHVTSIPEFVMDADGKLNVNASFQMGLEGSEHLTAPVFFFLTLFPFTIKYSCNKNKN